VATAKASTDDRSDKERRSVDDMHKAEISILKEEIEKYKRERIEMKRYIDQIDHKLSVTLAEKLRIQNQGNSLKKLNNHLGSEGDRLQRESASLREVIALRDEHIYVLENEKDGLQDAIKALRADSQREQQKLKGEIDFLRADNERLRTNIFRNESDLNPLRSEEYYIQLLEGLKGDVEGWIAGHAQRTPSQMLTISNEVIVLDILMSLGRAGENSGNFLIKNKSLQKEYCDVRTRITLIRHFVCLFLFDQILNPLAPGLPASISDSLAWMEEDMISQGVHLSEVF
jgi:predicted  nucleic acid-binding Zn-ribbon protein